MSTPTKKKITKSQKWELVLRLCLYFAGIGLVGLTLKLGIDTAEAIKHMQWILSTAIV